MVALKLWVPALRGQRFILNCDNKNCVFSLNSGRFCTRAMQLCLREIWFLSAAFDFELAAHHVEGTSNSLADHLSRWHLSPGHKAHFEALTIDILTVHIPCAAELFQLTCASDTTILLSSLNRSRSYPRLFINPLFASRLCPGYSSPSLCSRYPPEFAISVESVSSLLPSFPPHTPSRLRFDRFILSRVPVAQDHFDLVRMNHLNSIRLLHLHHGFACHVLNSFPVALTKKGLKRVLGSKSRQKHPITVDLLRRMRTVFDLSIPTKAALWCLFLVAFFSFLSKSNLTTPCAGAFDPCKHLTRNDLKFSRNGAVLRILWSKTLQHSEGILLIPLPLIPNSDLCPVTAIHHCFHLVPADVNSPFFCVPQGPLLHPITFSLFSSLLKTITAIGLDTTNFSGWRHTRISVRCSWSSHQDAWGLALGRLQFLSLFASGHALLCLRRNGRLAL